jgi:pSer/pThr/pTyr-binding forkhead associated (FHA) protein
MAKLYLKFEQSDQVLKEVALSQAPTTIGRLPDNNVQIDNLAVSGHHARISWEQGQYIVEDLGSLNGTYVNNERVGKAALKAMR